MTRLRRPQSGLHDDRQMFLQIASLRHLIHGHLGVGDDRGKNIVEIVGNTAGQRGDRLQFLRLQQLALKLHFVGQITDNHGIGEDVRGTGNRQKFSPRHRRWFHRCAG